MKEQLLKLEEVFAKAKGISIELGLIDEVKDRVSSSDKIILKVSEVSRQILSAKKASKNVKEMAETQIKIQKSLLSEVTKALSDLGVKQEPKEVGQLRSSNKSLKTMIDKMPEIK